MKLIYILIAAIVLSSCGTLHKIRTKNNTTKIDKKDSTVQVKEVIEEKIDTTVTVKGDSTHGIYQPDQVDTEEPEVVIDNERQKVTVKKDKKTGKLHIDAVVKDQEVPVQFERKTTRETNISVKKESYQRDKSKAMNKERQTIWTWKVFVGIIISIGFILLLLLWYFTRKINLINKS